MSGYAVDLELVEELVTQMGTFERHLETVRSDVEGRVRRTEAVWSGVAASESVDAHQRWQAGVHEMHEALTVLRTIATTARENYAAAMSANTRMWAL